MKYVLHSFMAMAIVLFMAACSEDRLASESGNEVNVSFTTSLAGAIQSKTISDGMTVDELIFQVFQKTSDGYKDITSTVAPEVSFAAGKGSVKATLAKGETYRFFFWAQKTGAPYTIGEDGTVTVSYDQANANDENRDAFYAVIDKDEPVTGAFTTDVELRRPFAQINLGSTTEDWKAAQNAGVAVEKLQSTIKVFGVPTSFNAFTGEVGEETTNVEFVATNVPETSGETLTVKEVAYSYVGMNYILAGKEKDIVDAEATISVEGTGKSFKLNIPAMPIQRNYRTNIIGNLLTANGQFNIIVDEEYNKEDHPVTIISISDATALASALTADLEHISITLNADIDLPISSLGTITGGSGEYKLGGENTKNITIDLNGKKRCFLFEKGYNT